jgi:hypothetical protein
MAPYKHGTVAKSTLADANSVRPYQIWGEMFYALYVHCQKLTPGHKFKIKMPVFILDSTTISFCVCQVICPTNKSLILKC